MAINVVIPCPYCGNSFEKFSKDGRPRTFCSQSCRSRGVSRGPKPRPIEDRFWEKVYVREPNECWPWTACIGTHGYGLLGSGKGSFTVLTHRLSWEIFYGRKAPKSMTVAHACDRKDCVNPFHLWLGTTSDNMVDMISKNRRSYDSMRGEKSKNARLTTEDVLKIRSDTRSRSQIAAAYGVSKGCIQGVLTGRSWGSLE